VKEKLANAERLSEIDTDGYDAVFYPGGHGPVIDLAKDPENIKIANEFHRAKKTVAAICHGVGYVLCSC
jgi:putative intracellular protease/amidase